MVNCPYESLFPRFTATSAARSRCRTEPIRGGKDLRRLGLLDQTLSKSPARNWSGVAKSDSRSSCQKRSSLAGPLESAARSPSRCHTRRALSVVQSRAWPRCEYGQHQSRQSGSGVDTKKKTLRASEQNETSRAAWREQMASLLSQDLVFVDETGSHMAMTP